MAAPNNSTEFAILALSFLDYCPDSGVFRWKRKPSRSSPIKVGSEAGTITDKGYRVIRINGTRIMAHRLAWFWAYEELPGEQIDHVNRIKDDNKIANLRLASNRENQENVNRRGYYLNRVWGRYVAQIMVDGKSIYLGGFDSEGQARKAYLKAKDRLHRCWTGENVAKCGRERLWNRAE